MPAPTASVALHSVLPKRSSTAGGIENVNFQSRKPGPVGQRCLYPTRTFRCGPGFGSFDPLRVTIAAVIILGQPSAVAARNHHEVGIDTFPETGARRHHGAVAHGHGRRGRDKGDDLGRTVGSL